jgi:hypothetical protein
MRVTACVHVIVTSFAPKHNIDALTLAARLCSQLCLLRDETTIQFTVGTILVQQQARYRSPE